ncbi:MAG: AAA family ATPase [Spirochaetota bacterium]
MKSLPIGISTFRFLIEDKLVYVDKTGIILPLVREKGRYFLSRPRRFGKSLLVDTFKELFEGNEPLFRGLAIHDSWDWSRKFPVIKIDFVSGVSTSRAALDERIIHLLKENAARLGIDMNWDTDLAGLFENLISGAAQVSQSPVVVLVDEYDKPLLDNIEDPAKAMEIREGLKNFYSPLKRLDGILQFVFLTGVSKFSKVNIFSGINNLMDLTLSPAYATICGYTQGDLETSFAEHLAGVDREQMKLWYNGYSFLGEAVYNPFDILLFIQNNHVFRNYWFETGTPTFLVKLMQKNGYFLPDLAKIEVGEEILSSFDLETIQPTTLLFQTGYLAIKKVATMMGRQVYTLGFPNLEVKIAFSDFLIGSYAGIVQDRIRYQRGVYDALLAGDLAALEASLRRLFSGIPWRNFTNNDLAEYEGYYASVLYAFFSAITCTVTAEDINNHGQADLTIRLADNIYVMEIKTVQDASPGTAAPVTVAPSVAPTQLAVAVGTDPATDGGQAGNVALAQIRARGYADKYLGQAGVRVFELGLVFSMAQRNLVQFAGVERS